MDPLIYPYRFRPVYKDYIWGGNRIVRDFHRDEPPGIYAESWEVSDRSDGMSVVINGPAAGLTLRQLMRERGFELLGHAPSAAFPLLVKLIDSRERLSVQVHPDAEGARRFGGEPKTEMWCVLDVNSGADVFAGLKPGVDRPRLEEALARKTITDVLNRVPVAAGDAVYVPGGRVHAIDAGCLLLEIQQNSNTTYRIFDWDRRGPDGQPRELHRAEALRVIRWDDRDPVKVPPRELERTEARSRWEVLRSPFFRVERIRFSNDWKVHEGDGFRIVFVVSGAVTLAAAGRAEPLPPGATCLVPAAIGDAVLTAQEPAEILVITEQ